MESFKTTSPMPANLLQPLRIAVLAVVLGSTGVAMAESRPSEAGRPTPAQMQKIFP